MGRIQNAIKALTGELLPPPEPEASPPQEIERASSPPPFFAAREQRLAADQRASAESHPLLPDHHGREATTPHLETQLVSLSRGVSAEPLSRKPRARKRELEQPLPVVVGEGVGPAGVDAHHRDRAVAGVVQDAVGGVVDSSRGCQSAPMRHSRWRASRRRAPAGRYRPTARSPPRL